MLFKAPSAFLVGFAPLNRFSSNSSNMKSQTSQPYTFRQPKGFDFLSFRLSKDAVRLLGGITANDEGAEFSNLTLFQDLLARMSFHPSEGSGFRRPLSIQPGQVQYSEPRLQQEWGIGRSRIRTLLGRMEEAGLILTSRTSVGSVMSFPSVTGWKLPGRAYAVNPLYAAETT